MKLGVAWTVDRDGSIHCMLHIPRRTRVDRSLWSRDSKWRPPSIPKNGRMPQAKSGAPDCLDSRPAPTLTLLPEVGCQIHDPLAIEQWQRDEPARPAPYVLERETDATPSGLRQLQHGSAAAPPQGPATAARPQDPADP